MSDTIYKKVTDRIIAELQKGVVPWRKPWTNSPAVNWVTQKPYQGINTLLLSPGEYATFLQVKEAGGRVKKDEKGSLVVFYKKSRVKNGTDTGDCEEDGEDQRYVWYKQLSYVYEINTQCTGLESRREEVFHQHDPISEAEEIIRGYIDGPPIHFASGRAVYYPARDVISVPPMEDYPNLEEYYSTVFHEQIHSTGHWNRLKRSGIMTNTKFGSQVYSKEELVAEIGATMLCAQCGIDNSTIENSAAYIGGWLRQLKSDPMLIMHASSQAQKAVKYMLGINDAAQNEEDRSDEDNAA
ncbi:ArdC family protein [Brevibacillus sp. 179-C9.3 HS]|uniref:ArdC family protein n=1 Tax=unclassified Brevibacillus TaxID=2684853 RepID=UPI0039A11D92